MLPPTIPQLPQLIDYMSPDGSMPRGTELCIVLGSERVLTEHSCGQCGVLNLTSRKGFYLYFFLFETDVNEDQYDS